MLLGSALNIFMLYWLVLAHCTQFVGIYDLASSSLCYVYVFYLIKNFHTTFFSFSPLLLFVGIYDLASSSLCYVYVFYLMKNFHSTFLVFSLAHFSFSF